MRTSSRSSSPSSSSREAPICSSSWQLLFFSLPLKDALFLGRESVSLRIEIRVVNGAVIVADCAKKRVSALPDPPKYIEIDARACECLDQGWETRDIIGIAEFMPISTTFILRRYFAMSFDVHRLASSKPTISSVHVYCFKLELIPCRIFYQESCSFFSNALVLLDVGVLYAGNFPEKDPRGRFRHFEIIFRLVQSSNINRSVCILQKLSFLSPFGNANGTASCSSCSWQLGRGHLCPLVARQAWRDQLLFIPSAMPSFGFGVSTGFRSYRKRMRERERERVF